MKKSVEQPPSMVRNLVGITDLAQAWGVSKSSIRDAFKKQGLPSVKIGRRRLFDIELANEWLAARTAEAAAIQ
jgi:excisionase family DNA binding protein